jgi:hypothetical protein
MSTVEPALKGMTALIGREGQACARADRASAGTANPAAAVARNLRRVVIDSSRIRSGCFANCGKA